MIYKTVLLCTAVLFLLSSCSSKDESKAVILVKKSGLTFPLYLYKIDTTGLSTIDSLAKPTGKDFKFVVTVPEPGAYSLSTPEIQTTFILGAGDTVTIDLSLQGGIQKEHPKYQAFRKFERSRQSIEKQADSLASLYVTAQVTDSFAVVREKIAAEFNNLLLQTRLLSASFLRNNPESIGVFVVLNSTFRQSPVFNYSITPEIFLYADSVLQKHHPGTLYSIRMHNIVMQLERKFGRPGKSIVTIKKDDIFTPDHLPGLNGKLVTIHPQKGTIAIIYLWDEGISSRKTTPTVKMLHEEFKSMGLDVYAVSFTEGYRNWASLIEIDKMWWNNMIDTSASQSQILKTYNIRRLPYFIVLDHNRKVLSHFATAGALEEWIRIYFKDNK